MRVKWLHCSCFLVLSEASAALAGSGIEVDLIWYGGLRRITASIRLGSRLDSSTTTGWLGGFNKSGCTGLDGLQAGLPPPDTQWGL